MVYGHFHEKSFTKVSYHELVCLDFKGNELGWFCLLKRKTFESCPIFGRVLYNPSPTTFATMVLWVARKMGFHFISVCEGSNTHAVMWGGYQGKGAEWHLQFSKGVGTWRVWPYLWFHQFSWCARLYCISLDIRMFHFKFEPWVHQMHLKRFGGKYLQVWNPGNHVMLECTVHLAQSAHTIKST
jgi:hypothetical protein